MIRERHGIADATKVTGAEAKNLQDVTVEDGDHRVLLILSANWPAGLTPEQARYIAQQLEASADRVEAQNACA